MRSAPREGGQKSISYSKKRRASLWASLVTVALPDIFMALSAASILAASRVKILYWMHKCAAQGIPAPRGDCRKSRYKGFSLAHLIRPPVFRETTGVHLPLKGKA